MKYKFKINDVVRVTKSGSGFGEEKVGCEYIIIECGTYKTGAGYKLKDKLGDLRENWSYDNFVGEDCLAKVIGKKREIFLIEYGSNIYPTGTNILTLKSSAKCIVTSRPFWSNGELCVNHQDSSSYATIFFDDKWATITKDPTPVQEPKCSAVVGKWYSNEDWGYKTDFAKCSELNFYDSDIIFSEKIRNGEYSKLPKNQQWTGRLLKEVSLEKISPYLPDGHPDKIIKKDEPMSSSTPDVLKVGDWIEITKSPHNWSSAMDKYVGKQCQITSVRGQSEGHTSVLFDGGGHWSWVYQQGHFKKITPPQSEVKPSQYKVGDWVILSMRAGGWGCLPKHCNGKTKQILRISSNIIEFDVNGENKQTIIKEISRLATQEEKMKEIQAECERRFPIGCKFEDTDGDRKILKQDSTVYSINNSSIYAHHMGGCLYDKGEYATLIELKPKPQIKETAQKALDHLISMGIKQGCEYKDLSGRTYTADTNPKIHCEDDEECYIDCGVGYLWKYSRPDEYGTYIRPIIPTEHKLITEAKQRYPVGTKFYPAHIIKTSTGDKYCIITDDSEFVIEGDCIYSVVEGSKFVSESIPKYGNVFWNRLLYSDGKWAEIVTPPKPPIIKTLPGKSYAGLSIGDKLPDGVITNWATRVENNYACSPEYKWKQPDYCSFMGERFIKSFVLIDGFVGFEVSGTDLVYLTAFGFKDFSKPLQQKTKPDEMYVGSKPYAQVVYVDPVPQPQSKYHVLEEQEPIIIKSVKHKKKIQVL